MWGVFWRKPNGSLKRVVSHDLPMVTAYRIAQNRLDEWAAKKGLPDADG
jgi:hypothetical protein